MANNPLSSLSYTNKDFNSIYVELLDIVKQLTHKWDPSISNESDPGVILLKLDAIIGDKNNYNIDKNILEAFPESVTQEVNARNAYKQLAYKMPWYQSATTTITLKWIGEELSEGMKIKIPRYTMVTNSDASVVYTLIEEPTFTATDPVITAKAVEGVIVTHTINGNEVIDIANLDMSNRVFLNDYTVAENGIFINNDGASIVNTWTLVDNLQVRTLGNKFYEFGVDSRNNCCYIEFPSDIDHLIETGVTIRYLISSGTQGNISAKTLDRFYEETTVDVAGEKVVLSADVVELYNASAAVNGSDPQELKEAFRTYRKTAGTFNTLVTLRDYINALYTSGLISNGYVCDRNNDLQSTYTVVTDDLVNPTYTYITESAPNLVKPEIDSQYDGDADIQTFIDRVWAEITDANLAPDLTAFDLRFYVMKNTGTISDIQQFNSTFDLIPSESSKSLELLGYLQEQQCIAHDFQPIVPNVPCMFQNAYPINIKIVPQSKLTDNQIEEVKVNILKSFYNILNARAVDFGCEADYALINDTIYQADERIKTAILDDIEYTTFAVYWDADKSEFKRIPINPLSDIDSAQVVEFSTLSELQLWKASTGSGKNALPRAQRDSACFIYTGASDTISYNVDDEILMSLTPATADSVKGTLKPYEIIKYNNISKEFYRYSDKYTEFQRQVLIRSILAGRTPLLEAASDFAYGINHQHIDEAELSKVTTGLTVSPYSATTEIKQLDVETAPGRTAKIPLPDFTDIAPTPPTEPGAEEAPIPTVGTYVLQPNETVRFLAPSFITTKSFSNYVKFELVLKEGKEVLHEVTAQEDALDTSRIYYMTLEDRTRAVYDTLHRLALVDTAIRYLSAEAKEELDRVRDFNTDGLTTQEKLIVEDVKDILSPAYVEIKDASTTTYSSANTYVVHLDNEDIYITEENKSTYVGADNKFISGIEVSQVTLYSSQDIRNIIRALSTQVENATFTNIESKIEALENELEERKTALKLFTGNQMVFENGCAHLGYEGQPTGTFVRLNVNGASLAITLINSDTAFNYNETENTLHTLITGHLEDDMMWPSSSVHPAYCSRKGIEKSAVLSRATSELDEFDCVVYSCFTCKNITLKYSKTVYQIPPDTDYKLKAGEQITFFWRKEDGDDIPYTYEHYIGLAADEETATKKSPIIRANFQLEGQPTSSLVNLTETGEIKSGTTAFKYVANMYGEQDLSGTKNIDIRQMNQVTLDRINGLHKKRNKYYFITKDIQDDEYKMTFKLTSHVPTDPNITDSTLLSYRYTLENEEFFIHTTLDTDEYEVLGAGTMIGIDVLCQDYADFDKTNPDTIQSSVTLGVEAIESETLFSGGLDVFGDSCAEIPRTLTMFCREQQIYTLAAGNSLHITMTDETEFKDANLPLAASVGVTNLKRPFFCTWIDTVVAGFEVSAEIEGSVQVLPKLEIADDADCRWVGRAYLNISSSTEEPQEIIGQYSDYVSKSKKSAQYIQYETSDGTWATYPNEITEREVDGDSGVKKDLTVTDSVMLATSIVVDKVGGRDVDISYIDGTGETNDTSIYVYHISENFNDGIKYKTRTDGCIEANIKNIITEKGLAAETQTLKLSEGTHILKVENTSDVAKFQLFIDNSTNPQAKLGHRISLFSQDDDYAYGYGVHYFKLDSDGNTFNLGLKFIVDGGATVPSTDILIFYPTVRGELNSLFFGEGSDDVKYRYLFPEEADVWSRITTLDNKSKFNYAHIVEDAVLIEDPLQSKSFFDLNHIYNDFTISKAEITLSKATGSSIQLVNNR